MKINHYFGSSATTEEVRFVRDVESFFDRDGKVTSVDVVGAVVTCTVTLDLPWRRRFEVSDLNDAFNRSKTLFRVEGDKVYCQYTLSKHHTVKVDSESYNSIDLSKNLILGVDSFGEIASLPISHHKIALVSGRCGSGKTYFLRNAIKKLIYANSSEDLQILVFSQHSDDFNFLKDSRFLYQSKVFTDLKEFIDIVKNLEDEKVLILAEDLEYAVYIDEDDNVDLMQELKLAVDRIKNRMILVSQHGRSDSKFFNDLVRSSSFRVIFYSQRFVGDLLSERSVNAEKLHRTGDAFAVDLLRQSVKRIEMISES